MKRLVSALCLFGVLALSLLAVPRCLQAAELDATQTASLTAALAQGNSYAQLIALAKASNMPQDAVVKFLAEKANNDCAKVTEIVDAALAAGYSAESVAFGTLDAGASLSCVLNATKVANADASAIAAGATKAGYTSNEIANANAGIFVGGPGTGGPGAGGPGTGGPGTGTGAGAAQGGNMFGGGSNGANGIGGGGGGAASPH